MTCPSNSPQWGYPCLRDVGHTDEHANSMWRWDNTPLSKLALSSTYGKLDQRGNVLRQYAFMLRQSGEVWPLDVVSRYPHIPFRRRVRYKVRHARYVTWDYLRGVGRALAYRGCNCDPTYGE